MFTNAVIANVESKPSANGTTRKTPARDDDLAGAHLDDLGFLFATIAKLLRCDA